MTSLDSAGLLRMIALLSHCAKLFFYRPLSLWPQRDEEGRNLNLNVLFWINFCREYTRSLPQFLLDHSHRCFGFRLSSGDLKS